MPADYKTVEVFSKHWERYDDWYDRNKFVYLSELAALRKLILKKNRLGLEIGVGTARFAVPLGIRFGVDLSFEMACAAERRGINVCQAEAEQLPFPDECFDFVLMVTTICFLRNVGLAFREARRVLKSKGRLIIGFVDKHSGLSLLYRQSKRRSVFYDVANFYSPEEVLGYLKEYHFLNPVFIQTIFNDLDAIKNIELTEEGYGKGAFVVVSSRKV